MKSIIVGTAVVAIIALLRRCAPRSLESETVLDNGRRLPFGAAGSIQWAVGVAVAIGGFFLFNGANHLWASIEKGATLTIYPTKVIWCFAPGFAALCIPYFALLWFLRKCDYAGQAAEIIAKGNAKINLDGVRVMRWLIWTVVLPTTLFTVLAIPMHLTLDDSTIRLTRYAHFQPEVFRYADALSAYIVDGYILRDGSFHRHPDLILVFADGRHLQATVMSDGSDVPPRSLVSALLARTGLHPTHLKTANDLQSSRKEHAMLFPSP